MKVIIKSDFKITIALAYKSIFLQIKNTGDSGLLF